MRWSVFFFSSRRRHTRFDCDWSSDVCSSDLCEPGLDRVRAATVAASEQVAHGNPQCLANLHVVIRRQDRKSTRLNSSHSQISYAVFCLKKKKKKHLTPHSKPRHALGDS